MKTKTNGCVSFARIREKTPDFCHIRTTLATDMYLAKIDFLWRGGEWRVRIEVIYDKGGFFGCFFFVLFLKNELQRSLLQAELRPCLLLHRVSLSKFFTEVGRSEEGEGRIEEVSISPTGVLCSVPLVWFRFSTGFFVFFLRVCVSVLTHSSHHPCPICLSSVSRSIRNPRDRSSRVLLLSSPILNPQSSTCSAVKRFKKKKKGGEEEWIRKQTNRRGKDVSEVKTRQDWGRKAGKSGKREEGRGWSELDLRAEDSVFEISATTNPQHSLSIRVWTGLLQLMPWDKNCKTESEGEKIRGIETRDLERNVLLIAALWRR